MGFNLHGGRKAAVCLLSAVVIVLALSSVFVSSNLPPLCPPTTLKVDFCLSLTDVWVKH